MMNMKKRPPKRLDGVHFFNFFVFDSPDALKTPLATKNRRFKGKFLKTGRSA